MSLPLGPDTATLTSDNGHALLASSLDWIPCVTIHFHCFHMWTYLDWLSLGSAWVYLTKSNYHLDVFDWLSLGPI